MGKKATSCTIDSAEMNRNSQLLRFSGLWRHLIEDDSLNPPSIQRTYTQRCCLCLSYSGHMLQPAATQPLAVSHTMQLSAEASCRSARRDWARMKALSQKGRLPAYTGAKAHLDAPLARSQ